MDEKIVGRSVELVKTSVTQTTTELNNKGEQYREQTSGLNGQLAAKDAGIAELNEKLATTQADLATKGEAMEAQTSELNSLKEADATLEKEEKIARLNSALSEFSAGEQTLAQAEIDAFKADPTTIEINGITNKIYVEVICRNKEVHNVELNNDVPDISGGVSFPEDKGDVDIFG